MNLIISSLSRELDPRFKKLHFKNPLACARAIDQIKENMRMIVHQNDETLPEESNSANESENSVSLGKLKVFTKYHTRISALLEFTKI